MWCTITLQFTVEYRYEACIPVIVIHTNHWLVLLPMRYSSLEGHKPLIHWTCNQWTMHYQHRRKYQGWYIHSPSGWIVATYPFYFKKQCSNWLWEDYLLMHITNITRVRSLTLVHSPWFVSHKSFTIMYIMYNTYPEISYSNLKCALWIFRS